MPQHRFLLTTTLAVAASLASPATVRAQSLAAFEKKVTEHRLANGWRFLIVEDHSAPVASFFTHVDVGSCQEVPGITGLAHMFEHMAFKGTDRIGTTDAEAEAAAIERVEAAFVALKSERQRIGGADPRRLDTLEKAFQAAQEAAAKFVKQNEFGQIIEREGGEGLNAFTSNEETGYFFELPANKVELWAYLESERFLHPVLRDFYKERDVVKEERRLRTESSPFGRLVEEFLSAAFKAHPYGVPVVGHMSDLDSFTMEDARAFYRKHYVPANMVTAIVGDVTPGAVVPLLEAYFGRIAAGPPSEPLRTVEPPQGGERSVALIEPSQPIYVEGYHVPAATHGDAPALQALAEVLGRGRTSRLYRALVRDARSAASVQAFRGLPGDKYPGLFGILVVPVAGHAAREMGEAVHREIERLRTEPVSAAELAQVKSRAKADLVRQLNSRQGLAFQLGTYATLTGDWRDLFRDVERLDAVTSDDIRRVVGAYLKPENRTVGRIVNDPKEL